MESKKTQTEHKTKAPALAHTLAPAKINLTLTLTGERRQGRHLLQSLVVFADDTVADVVHIKPHPRIFLEVLGFFAAKLPKKQKDNLVVKAAHLYAKTAGARTGAKIRLQKNIPVAAGLGGASCDAAAVLRLLSGFWGNTQCLESVAKQLGSDVPVCLLSRPAFVRGTGEHITPLKSFPSFGLVLARPPVALQTARVFAAAKPPKRILEEPPKIHDKDSLFCWLKSQNNDLEQAAMTLTPLVGQCLNALRATPNVLLARMSGSGATCFGICHTPQEARHAAQNLKKTYPHWWVRATYV